ncbi:hypothetical protein K7432_010106 [Basidiobolus ranarum]|uniref:Uncharacterized protein n=1 Tax=Basidiobolus ranarum TaxID=34480 RepID=A0ABR2WP68_9FUNG
MLSEVSVPQYYRSYPQLERSQSPRICSAQSIPTKPFRPSPLNNVSDEQHSPILAPSPKKMMYRAGSFSSEVDDCFSWTLPNLDEDSDEDSFDSDSLSDQVDGDDSGEAFAELFKIIHKPSAPSSPRFGVCNIKPSEVATLDDFAEKQGFCEYLGRSPIFRTQNPLPLDTMFYKCGPAAASNVKIYEPCHSSNTTTHLNIADPSIEASPAGLPQMTANKSAINHSFEKCQPRPRSYSVGARPDQSGSMF